MATDYELFLERKAQLAKPIPYRGQLGLWNFPDELLPEEFR